MDDGVVYSMKEAMVARAKKRKWVNLVAILFVGATAQPLALFAGPDTDLGSWHLQAEENPPAVAQLTGRPSRAHEALNRAIDAQRQGDLDSAAALFQEAQARQNDLTPAERDELARLLSANTLARKARRDAHEQLEMAELALAQGRTAEAVALVKKITANELYLSAADKQRFGQLSQKLHVQPAAAPSGNAVVQAHGKVQQARAELTRGNLDVAEALAREAEQLRVSFGPHEDSPPRVLEDLDKARKDPKTMLQASRAALQRGELDRAEHYARVAERLASAFTFSLSMDSPSKALKDIQAARAAGPRTTAANRSNTPSQPDMGNGTRGATAPAPAAQPTNADKARALVRQGRQALAAGNLTLERGQSGPITRRRRPRRRQPRQHAGHAGRRRPAADSHQGRSDRPAPEGTRTTGSRRHRRGHQDGGASAGRPAHPLEPVPGHARQTHGGRRTRPQPTR
jgi:hypothetical protein